MSRSPKSPTSTGGRVAAMDGDAGWIRSRLCPSAFPASLSWASLPLCAVKSASAATSTTTISAAVAIQRHARAGDAAGLGAVRGRLHRARHQPAAGQLVERLGFEPRGDALVALIVGTIVSHRRSDVRERGHSSRSRVARRRVPALPAGPVVPRGARARGRSASGPSRAARRAPRRSPRSRGRTGRGARPRPGTRRGACAAPRRRRAALPTRSSMAGPVATGSGPVGMGGHRPPAPPPQLVERGVGRDPVAPGAERGPPVEAGRCHARSRSSPPGWRRARPRDGRRSRRHTAWIRSAWRSRSTSSARRSPPDARAARTASLSSRNPHLAHVDVVLPVLARGQLGEPEQHRAPLDPPDIEGVRSLEVGAAAPAPSPQSPRVCSSDGDLSLT